ncbi:unnamed protein product [Anisakis simplex]|uniref:Cadherin domain-containing protein n=1 Tax=Anisakis simplex TaxID=6269 RepID=A0A0M3KA32_ANISI|nr:unnamed protein product [Anisakis simplex]
MEQQLSAVTSMEDDLPSMGQGNRPQGKENPPESNFLSAERQLDGSIETIEKTEEEQQIPTNDADINATIAFSDDTRDLKRNDSKMSDTNDEKHLLATATTTVVNDLQIRDEIDWSDAEIFDRPITIGSDTKFGDEVLSVKAKNSHGNVLEFVCYRPDLVYCLTDFITPGNYQLRVVYSSEQNPKDFHLPFAVIIQQHRNDSTIMENIYENKNFTIEFVVSNETNSLENDDNQQQHEHEISTLEIPTEQDASSESTLKHFSSITTVTSESSDEGMKTSTATASSLAIAEPSEQIADLFAIDDKIRSESVPSSTTESSPNASEAIVNSSDAGNVEVEILSLEPKFGSIHLESSTSEKDNSAALYRNKNASDVRKASTIDVVVTTFPSDVVTDESSNWTTVSTARTTPRVTVANIMVNLNSSLENTPNFEFLPHFEHSTYEIVIPEGKTQEEQFLAVVFFIGRLGTSAPSFEIMFDRLKWFKIGDIMTKQESNHLISAVKIMLRADVDVDKSKTSNGFYKFSIKGKQAEFISMANVKIEIMTVKVKLTTLSPPRSSPSMVKNDSSSEKDLAASTQPTWSSSEADFNTDTTKSNDMNDSVVDITTRMTTQTDYSIVTTTEGMLTSDKEMSTTDKMESGEHSQSSSSVPALATTTGFPSAATAPVRVSSVFGANESPEIGSSETERNDIENEVENFDSEVGRVSSLVEEDESNNVMNATAEVITEIASGSKGPYSVDETEGMLPTTEKHLNFESSSSDESNNKSVGAKSDENVNSEWILNGNEDSSERMAEESLVNMNAEESMMTMTTTETLLTVEESEVGQNASSSRSPTAAAQGNDHQFEVDDHLTSVPTTTTNPEMSSSDMGGDLLTNANADDTIALSMGSINTDENIEGGAAEDFASKTTRNPRIEETSESGFVTTTTESLDSRLKTTESGLLLENLSRGQSRTYNTELKIEFRMPNKRELHISEGLRNGEIVPNFEILVTAKQMDPYDTIMLSVNSTAFEMRPNEMQPGKTVFLMVNDNTFLDYETAPNEFTIEISANMRTRPLISVSKRVIVVKEDVSDIPPKFLSTSYDFHVQESSITGQKVGQLEVEDLDETDRAKHSYKLIGPGSEL